MKDLETKIQLRITSSNEFLAYLKSNFAEQGLKYKKFSDIYEINNGEFIHSIWYNSKKSSVVKTKRKKEVKELTILNLSLLILLLIALFLNRKFDWIEDATNFFWAYLILTLPLNYIVNKMKPKYKESLNDTHEKFIKFIKDYK